MSKAVSIHLGLNRIDPGHYGTNGALRGCVNDATSMQALAQKAGFSTTVLLNEDATSTQLFAFLDRAERELKSGDTLLITYAGHGSQVPDLNNDEKSDGKDETWCTFDRMVVDDELGEAWSRFAAGVRIIVVSDSCHSATVARHLEIIAHATQLSTGRELKVSGIGPLIGNEYYGVEVSGYRALPEEYADAVNERFRELYARIQATTTGNEKIVISASIITLAACLDEQTAGDGKEHGLFTQNLLSVWDEGRFSGTYDEFLTAIRQRTAGQKPNYELLGAPNAAFKREKPFTITSVTRSNSKGESMANKMDVIDLDQELRDLKSNGGGNGNGNSTRQMFDTSNGDRGANFARLELFIPRQFILDSSNSEIFNFFKSDGADALMKATLGAKNISVPRGISGDVHCSVDHEGHVGCSAGIRF